MEKGSHQGYSRYVSIFYCSLYGIPDYVEEETAKPGWSNNDEMDVQVVLRQVMTRCDAATRGFDHLKRQIIEKVGSLSLPFLYSKISKKMIFTKSTRRFWNDFWVKVSWGLWNRLRNNFLTDVCNLSSDKMTFKAFFQVLDEKKIGHD